MLKRPAIPVAPAPAPASVMSLLISTDDDHVADPAETLIVSPFFAFETQLATLVRSGVLVHVGLPPVQAALTRGAVRRSTSAGNSAVLFRHRAMTFNPDLYCVCR